MKEKELREAAECAACNKKLGQFGIPIFHRLTMQTYGVDTNALRRQSGMEQMMGNVALAQVMGADEDMASPIGEAITVTLCMDCSTEQLIPAALFDE